MDEEVGSVTLSWEMSKREARQKQRRTYKGEQGLNQEVATSEVPEHLGSRLRRVWLPFAVCATSARGRGMVVKTDLFGVWRPPLCYGNTEHEFAEYGVPRQALDIAPPANTRSNKSKAGG